MNGWASYMGGLRDHLVHLRSCAERLDEILTREVHLECLEDLVRQVESAQRTFVLDRTAPLWLRRTKVLVVVGDGGLPGDGDTVHESVDFGGDFGSVLQPGLRRLAAKGKVIITASEFLKLASWLRVEVIEGRQQLPYHPPSPI